MLVTYFDEVKYQKGRSPYYWLGAIVADATTIWKLEGAVNDLAQEVFGHRLLTKGSEFHAADLMNGHEHFKGWPLDKRLDVLKSWAHPRTPPRAGVRITPWTSTTKRAARLSARPSTCQAMGQCYSCKKPSRMFALMVLPPFTLEGAQDEALDEDAAMLSMPGDLPTALVQAMRPITGNLFRQDHSRMAGASYWMNHCEHCDAKQGDHFVQGPDGPFWPYDEAGMNAIEATRLEGPFRLPDASTSYSGAMADWRDWRHGVVRPPPPVRKPRKRRSPASRK